MKTIFKSLAALVASILLTSNGVAHHSTIATFNPELETTIEGVITDYRFRNPHVLIYIDVSDQNGMVTNWMAEGSAATGWRRNGWNNNSLSAGEYLRVTGDGTHDGSPMVWIDQMTLLDPDTKQKIAELSSGTDPETSRSGFVTSSSDEVTEEIYMIPTHLPTGEPNFTGTTIQRNGIVELPNRGGPDANDMPHPYNELGRAVYEESDLADDPQVFCEQPGVVRQAGYTPYGFKLTQYPDHITIEYEEYGSKRAVFFGDELPKPGRRSHMGDSVARYEGDALIIETVNLLPNHSGHRGTPLSEQARVTEVYTRIDNPDIGSIVKTETTVVDPKYLTEPWTIARYKLYAKDYEFIENECEPPLRARPADLYQYTEFDMQFLD